MTRTVTLRTTAIIKRTAQRCCSQICWLQPKQVYAARITRDSVSTDLQLYPYRLQIKQRRTPDGMRKQVTMCQRFCDRIDDVPDIFDDAWLSDEAHFMLSGHVNSKNNVLG